MLKIIPLLTDPESHGGKAEDSFDVIVPSLPGYGFSDRPTKRGMTISSIANIWAHLMTNVLGYDRFAAQGGDHGASVTEQLAVDYGDLLIGIHLDMVPVHHVFERSLVEELSQSEKDYLQQLELWLQEEGGYALIQGTKPQTLSYALNDSPTGLAAWIVEKFHSWSDCDASVEKRFTKDELLTNITLYWLTETVNSASRLYYEAAHDYDYAHPKHHRRSDVDTGVAIFPKDILTAHLRPFVDIFKSFALILSSISFVMEKVEINSCMMIVIHTKIPSMPYLFCFPNVFRQIQKDQQKTFKMIIQCK
jgi:pimeloyl-ACP methyl ester carboxylesterase